MACITGVWISYSKDKTVSQLSCYLRRRGMLCSLWRECLYLWKWSLYWNWPLTLLMIQRSPFYALLFWHAAQCTRILVSKVCQIFIPSVSLLHPIKLMLVVRSIFTSVLIHSKACNIVLDRMVMACCIFSTKPLYIPVLGYCQLDPWEQTSVKF